MRVPWVMEAWRKRQMSLTLSHFSREEFGITVTTEVIEGYRSYQSSAAQELIIMTNEYIIINDPQMCA